MIGFSAGAMIALAAAVSSGEREGPDFIAPIYVSIAEYMRPLVVPPTAVPIFLAVASDDQLGFAPASTEVYNTWLAQTYWDCISTRRAGTDSACANKAYGRFVERKV